MHPPHPTAVPASRSAPPRSACSARAPPGRRATRRSRTAPSTARSPTAGPARARSPWSRAGVEGRPGTHDFAGCTQQVSVRPYGTYELTATVSGAYAFVGVLGGPDTEAVYRWADGEHETRLHATIRVGAHTQILTVYFHGWYNQGPYRLDGISLYGSTDLPSCPDMTGAPPSSPRPPLPSTRAPAALVPTPSPSWTGMNCMPPPSAQPSSTAPPRPGTT
ncbi:hypothetical protein [Streptomyces sp. TLI_171]|uniref:hypothetical protein n=1 Tax=Streptomyces sp. TLI_171 TaxID=1938859 RepID=UPI0011805EF8|nr:hypothetical protein [Streptomyces sp. TLI_171]